MESSSLATPAGMKCRQLCTCASTFISSRICEKDRLDPCGSQANEERRVSTSLTTITIWIPWWEGALAVTFHHLVDLLSKAEQSTGYSRGQTKRITGLNFEHSYQRSKQSRYRHTVISLKAPIDVGGSDSRPCPHYSPHRTDISHRNKLPTNSKTVNEFPSLFCVLCRGQLVIVLRGGERMACGFAGVYPLRPYFVDQFFFCFLVPNFNRNEKGGGG